MVALANQDLNLRPMIFFKGYFFNSNTNPYKIAQFLIVVIKEAKE